MALRIGDVAPNFTAETTEGRINFHEWLGDSWGVLFSHPKDFTPVCTTELGTVARLKPEFDKRKTKVIGLSVDSVESHTRWAKDIEETQGHAPNYPMIGDTDLAVSKAFQMLSAEVEGVAEGRTAADNQTVRSVFVVGPDKKIKLSLSYPMSTGRNFHELLRAIDSLQLTANYKVATPANWETGEDVIILPSVSADDAKKAFPDGWRAPKPYMRFVPQPNAKKVVRYRRDDAGAFDAPLDRIFAYMSAGDHPHQAFKSHKLVGKSGNIVTIDSEIYTPEGATFKTIITHKLSKPNGIESTMTGGAFDGARFNTSYKQASGKVVVGIDGEFPAMAGVPEADQLKMIDGFFTQAFNEDAVTLRTWK
jgi:alkyl hydroperoxide reductase subunit AhpC